MASLWGLPCSKPVYCSRLLPSHPHPQLLFIVARCHIFLKLDLVHAYHQIPAATATQPLHPLDCHNSTSPSFGSPQLNRTPWIGFYQGKCISYILVFVGSENLLHKVEICAASIHNRADIFTFFAALFGAVHQLLQMPISLKVPCMAPIRDKAMCELKPRVHR